MQPQAPPPGNVTMMPVRQVSQENLRQSMDWLENRLINIKRNTEELLRMLDAQDKVAYPDLITKAANISSDFSSVQSAIRRSFLTKGADENNGMYLKQQLVLPYMISLDPNPTLMELTQGRVPVWSHDEPPTFLRTMLPPEIESEIGPCESEAAARLTDNIAKIVTTMNKHLDLIISNVNSHVNLRQAEARKAGVQSVQTDQIVRSVYIGGPADDATASKS